MSTYISASGLEELKQELVNRKSERREIAGKIESAKELGDLSENFEYHEARDQQAMNETRIIELEDIVKDFVIVEEKRGGNVISLGSKFVVSINGGEKTFELVGSNEANPLDGKISNESPIGQAFIGHGVGETVDISVPSGTMQYKIISIM